MSTYNYNKIVEYIETSQNDFYLLAYGYVKNREAALDIVQESIYKALSSANKIRNIEYVKTWFYRILVNTSISYLRKNKRIILSDKVPEMVSPENKSLAEIYDLYDAIDKLNPKFKTVIMLRYFEDMKIDEIAKVLDCNVNTVKSRIYASLGKLKRIIEGEG